MTILVRARKVSVRMVINRLSFPYIRSSWEGTFTSVNKEFDILSTSIFLLDCPYNSHKMIDIRHCISSIKA